VPDVAGYILVGGKSSRFGRDKALVDVGGRPLALRVADALAPVTGAVTLVGAPEKYRHLGLRVIPDPLADFGPLAGILAALEDSKSAWNLLVACDMPGLSAEFLSFLLARARESQADVVLPVDAEDRPEPLCAAYALGSLEAIRRAVERGTRKVTAAFDGLRVQHLLPAEYFRLDPDGRLFTNLNSPADWEKLG
jgi:molybdopterin-guanine dinucleotide biosynthesis protein A